MAQSCDLEMDAPLYFGGICEVHRADAQGCQWRPHAAQHLRGVSAFVRDDAPHESLLQTNPGLTKCAAS